MCPKVPPSRAQQRDIDGARCIWSTHWDGGNIPLFTFFVLLMNGWESNWVSPCLVNALCTSLSGPGISRQLFMKPGSNQLYHFHFIQRINMVVPLL